MTSSLRELLSAATVTPSGRALTFTRAAGVLMLAVIVCGLLLFVAQVLLLNAQRPTLRLAADSREATVLLDGFHATERDARGRYRWSEGTSRISFPQVSVGGPLVLGLELGAPPVQLKTPRLSLSYGAIATTIVTDDRPRRYQFLLPPVALRNNGLTVDLQSQAVQVPPDTRPVGLRFEAITLALTDAMTLWPSPLLVAVQTLLLGLVALVLHRLTITSRLIDVVLVLSVLALLWLAGFQPLLVYPYLLRLACALAVLAGLTFVALPQVERALRRFVAPDSTRSLWGVAVLACAIRLSGALYPTFAAHDLALNVDRFLKTVNGTLLVLNRSIEFGHGVTIYPPASYLTLLPSLLLGLSPELVVAAGLALLDGFSALAIGVLARALGLSKRAALLGALLYAALPVSLAVLYFGQTAQTFGQALMVPIALALLLALRRSNARAWLAAGTLLLVALLSHIGVTILAVVWLGLAWLLLLLQRNVSWTTRWRFALVLAVACLFALGLIYADVVSSHIEQTRAIGEDVASEGYDPSYWLVAQGFLIAFHRLGLLLLPFGLLLLPRRRLGRGGSALVGAWLVAVCLFLAVELTTGLQVRYIYFLTPIACVLIGLLLDRLAARGLTARWVAWSIIALLLVQGSATWYAGTFIGARISMVSLLR